MKLGAVRNAVPSAYRGVAVTSIDSGDLSEQSLIEYFVGRESYRRTRFIVVRGSDEHVALVHVTRDDDEPLFAPITALELLSGPDETAYLEDSSVDTAIPSSLAAIALSKAPWAKAVIVRGAYEHISFILNPEPIRLRVLEVVPPRPAKLVDQVRRILDTAEDLAPMVIEEDVLQLAGLAEQHPSDSYLMPCRGSDMAVPGARSAYLDERPERDDWMLLGCARSREIHRWFYGDEPPSADICPRNRPLSQAGAALAKCCLLESSIAIDDDRVVVPWGSTLQQVREALGIIAAQWEPTWSPV